MRPWSDPTFSLDMSETSAMIREKKKALRREIRAMRQGLSEESARRMSARVMAGLKESGLLQGRRNVALYASADLEVNTRPLFEDLIREGVRVFLPRVRGKGPELDFFRVSDWDGLIISPLGIPEPGPEGEAADYGEFDFVLVPGIAFDRRGGRLGYGMGCYDRVLEKTRPGAALVGVGYDFQLVSEVPMDEHDVFLSAIVTESKVLPSGDRSGG